ncbi:MAG: DUF1800 domain-containing protein, partial [Bacillota bacterium]
MASRVLSVALLAGGLAVAATASAGPIGIEGARHLLDRAGFGATPAEVSDYAVLDRHEAVTRLLDGTRRESVLKPPAFVDEPFVPFSRLRMLDPQERQAEQRRRVEEAFALREWWMREMLTTSSPLTERMTLFWHNHFATSQQKVRSATLMYRQNALLRREALGNFATMLHAVARDPAMLIYLDNARSRRQAPNENFAREVMELFTLGEGHYTERDIKEAARAFTGWSLDPETGTFLARPAWHDAGAKTVLGKTGNLDGDDVLDTLLARDETAEFIAGKLWREFVSPTPDPVEVKRLAKVFRDAHYEVKPLLAALFESDAFWSQANRASLIKSPVDLVVGTLRTFGIHPMDLRPAVVATAALGQNLFTPPNVKGWPGGERWINTATLLGRKQFVERVAANDDRMEAPMANAAMQDGAPGENRAQRILQRGLANYRIDARAWGSIEPHLLDAVVLAAA